MAEYHFWNPNFIFWMLCYIDTVSIIIHVNCAIGINSNLDIGYRYRVLNLIFYCLCLTNDMVTTIYDTFIE